MWRCETCEDKPEFETNVEVSLHLLKVHNIELHEQRGIRRLVQALDGSDWFSNTFEFIIQGVSLIQTVEGKRREK